MSAPNLKIIVQGSSGVGKTCLLIRYTENKFPTEYVPTVFDNYSASVSITDKRGKASMVSISLWDFMHREDSARLRPLSYPSTHVVLLCYPCIYREGDPSPVQRVEQEWYPELTKWMPKVPIILVRTKCDLDSVEAISKKGDRNSKSPYRGTAARRYEESQVVPWDEAETLAHRLGLAGHLKCSALTSDGVQNVFQTAIIAALDFASKHPGGAPSIKTGMSFSPENLEEYPDVPDSAARQKKVNRCILC